nr:tRNA (5-methylaminomethyl-2-thiouridine)(34)-methyltransferase MnmD [Parvularcula mediterranea]
MTHGDAGALYSEGFGDIYYSPDDGLAETRHVFIEGNELGARLGRGRLVVGELGFGTGLNVLALLAKAKGAPVDVFSVEGFPLPREEFVATQKRIAERWPEIAPYAERLAEIYPDPVPGFVRLEIAEGQSLTLAFGPVLEQLRTAEFKADAWFLDGFAPSKNPDMWSPEVMAEIARLTEKGGTAATFSVAGAVRQSLETAGFSWEKIPGFGRKKHMLRARLEEYADRPDPRPWFIPPSPALQGPVAIVGCGIAGATVARALKSAGREVVIYDPEPASGASGNPGGLVMPRLDAEDNAIARFYRDAFLYAERFYRGLDGVLDPCGGEKEMAKAKAESVLANGLWPDSVLSFSNGLMHVPRGGVLRPAEAITQLADGIEVRRETVSLSSLPADAATVIFASGSGFEAHQYEALERKLGQIDLFDTPVPNRVRTGDHYAAPLAERLLTGATYDPFEGGHIEVSAERTAINRQKAEDLLGAPIGASVSARSAVRLNTSDRHPIAGPLYAAPEELASAWSGLAKGQQKDYPPATYAHYALTGLGSRGLVTAPILAAHVAAQITGGVSPLARDQMDLVHPGRFMVRAIKRGKLSP